jgi:hypothetical protein
MLNEFNMLLQRRRGGSGGGGAYVEAIVKVGPGDVLEVVVGAGGLAGMHGSGKALMTLEKGVGARRERVRIDALDATL